tara:strand:- start:67 stop:882 length:816 start_codon:yes stop_codon:yes gene_type:complete
MKNFKNVAIIAGAGNLPRLVYEQLSDPYVVGFEEMECSLSKQASIYSFNQLGKFFEDLNKRGIRSVVMAGGMQRPLLDKTKFDDYLKARSHSIFNALQQGDDALLKYIISLFLEESITPIGAHEVIGNLTLKAGVYVGSIDNINLHDVKRADQILQKTSCLDIGQSVVVEAGQVLGIETVQGTKQMLGYVRDTSNLLRRVGGGVFVKREKIDQDLRADMPTIGPETILQVYEAKLDALVISPDTVLVIEQDECFRLCKKLSLSFIVKERNK